MSLLSLVPAVVAGLAISRAGLLAFFAEMGRRQDLVRHLHKGGTDFHIAIVVPYLDPRKLGGFRELLAALDKQDYPANRIGIHVIATQESAIGLPGPEDLPGNLKVWTYPAKTATRGKALPWLIERLLASGGPSRLFVFLDADDIVRPDFLKNVTTRAFDCFAMQGYIALKRPPQGFAGAVNALSIRLTNRIENAGRYHLGLSCNLMNSGWVIRQELLEMLPFRQGDDIDNLEYATLLNLQGYRINWAPNVLVYKEERVNFTELVRTAGHSLVNRFRLIGRYGLPLLFQSVSRLNIGLLEQASCLIKPPNFILGAIGVLLAWTVFAPGNDAGSLNLWSLLVTAYIATQVIALGVARCTLRDVFIFTCITPFVYALGLLALPFFLLGDALQGISLLGKRPRRVRMGLRFDENQPTRTIPVIDDLVDPLGQPKGKIRLLDRSAIDNLVAGLRKLPPGEGGITIDTAMAHFDNHLDESYRERVATVDDFEAIAERVVHPAGNGRTMITEHTEAVLPVTNGNSSVNCVIHIYRESDNVGDEQYYLVFEYKTLSFTTQHYRILDQAYYELQTKLKGRGFTIGACGSCAYFYHPTAGNSYGVAKDIGFCLFGKEGRDLDFDADSVTVVSPACTHLSDMAHRATVQKEWQESLNTNATQQLYSAS